LRENGKEKRCTVSILYFAIDPNSKSSGISRKIKAQALSLGKLSHSCSLVMVNYKTGVYRYKFNNKTRRLDLIEKKMNVFGKKKGLTRFLSGYLYYRDVLPALLDKVCQEDKVNCVYCRRIPSSMLLFCFNILREIKNKFNLFFLYEIPTYPYLVEQFKINPLFALFDLAFFRRFSFVVDHFFVVTDAKSEKKIKFKNWTRITNGIVVEEVPLRSSPPSLSEGLHLLGVANVAFWHGYDRVIKGLSRYYSQKEKKYPVLFHVVGEGPEKQKLMKMTQELGLEDVVIFHGSVFGRDLDRLFDSCHVAVASLGLHRINLLEGSVLKAREYCARGIPFFISIKDPDFKKGLDFVHYIPANDDPVDIDCIIKYSQGILKNERFIARRMREYVKLNLDWDKIMNKVFEVMQKHFRRLAAQLPQPRGKSDHRES
jgi:glycosyltransferase involved in cell wall biosynthesis